MASNVLEAAKELFTVLDGRKAAVAVVPFEEMPASKCASSMAAKMPERRRPAQKAPSRGKGGEGERGAEAGRSAEEALRKERWRLGA